jgi:hypothetical protein
MINGNGSSNSNRYFLRCEVEPGMFIDELLAMFEGADPAAIDHPIKIQVLVDAELVNLKGQKPSRGHPTTGQLVVEMIEKLHDWALIALPQPGIPVGSTAVVRNDKLSPVA